MNFKELSGLIIPPLKQRRILENILTALSFSHISNDLLEIQKKKKKKRIPLTIKIKSLE